MPVRKFHIHVSERDRGTPARDPVSTTGSQPLLHAAGGQSGDDAPLEDEYGRDKGTVTRTPAAAFMHRPHRDQTIGIPVHPASPLIGKRMTSQELGGTIRPDS